MKSRFSATWVFLTFVWRRFLRWNRLIRGKSSFEKSPWKLLSLGNLSVMKNLVFLVFTISMGLIIKRSMKTFWNTKYWSQKPISFILEQFLVDTGYPTGAPLYARFFWKRRRYQKTEESTGTTIINKILWEF